jgi:gamma-glutamyltranspeptidase/glutathione hydrolase
MTETIYLNGIAVAPHHLAAKSAKNVLQEGGNAIEAMVAAAACIAAVYPHMTSIGGDAFWLIHEPGKMPLCIDACGAAALLASIDFYREQGLGAIPVRGPLAANTVAGTISGWKRALVHSSTTWGGKLPLARLLADAIRHARDGIEVTLSQHTGTATKLDELKAVPGFTYAFLKAGLVPQTGERFVLPRLAATLERLAHAGLDDFYRGDIANSLARDLERIGSPIRADDLARHEALMKTPLALKHSRADLFNMTPPTQGVVSLAILGILDKLGLSDARPDSADYVHLCVEATKQAFLHIRDRFVTDPAYMTVDAQSLLSSALIAEMAARVDRTRAAPWGAATHAGDTVWMGVIDNAGRAVSFIQSIYHEFGSGVVLTESGVNWQNRGTCFSLDPGHINALSPGKKPFHTLNPALALFRDGRVMPYGTMGGDGQPQTQCAVFTRVALHNRHPQEAISAPRWLLGRTWGKPSDTLKLEHRFPQEVFDDLKARGHDIEWIGAMDEAVGHAGALIRNADGTLVGGYDPRSDGAVAGF